MSDTKLRVSSKEGLNAFLTLLAEQGIVKAREDLRNGTYASEEEILQRAASDEKRTQSDAARDLERLGNSWGTEFKPMQAAEEADEDIFKAIAKSGNAKKKSKPEASPNPKEKEPTPDEAEPKSDDNEEDFGAEEDSLDSDEGGEEIRFTMIRDELNTIRSGRSLRDQDIREELKSYFKKLDPEEKIALHAFLKGIGQILTAGLDSDQASDPSKDPHDVKMTRGDDGGDTEAGPTKPKQTSSKSPVKKPVKRSKQRGLEDTSAPIQVGKRQATESLRRALRNLME